MSGRDARAPRDKTREGIWQLDLSFERAGARTVLARRHVGYPFNITAPLQTDAPCADVIVQSVSGGIYGGERLGQHLSAGAGAQAMVRMPSAAVVHAARSGERAHQCVSMQAAEGAFLSYLPRPLILFPGSAFMQTMEVTVAGSATVLIRDGFLLHDPQAMPSGARDLRNHLIVRKIAGGVIAMDQMRIDDGMIDTASPGVTNTFRAFGAVWLIRRMDATRYQSIRTTIARLFSGSDDCYVSTSALRDDGGAVVRVAAIDGGALDAALDAIVATLQDMCLGRAEAAFVA
ncbi:MAG TPA: urease accessory protein UreD [Vineibacter sp.]|nr:urease accessory protein UreD [Vineibacter sp.]